MRRIALVGVGLRAPGADSARELWEVLSGERETTGEVPPSRFDVRQLGGVGAGAKRGGFIAELARFEAVFFGISAHDAERLDPAARKLLEVVWDACEDAGVKPSRLSEQKVGTYVGAIAAHFERDEGGELAAVVGRSQATLATRIAYTLGLRGPSMVLDTDRSSSLVALDTACRDLDGGRVDAALVCGANIIVDPAISIAFDRAGLLSPEGRCKFGDASANGFVRSEGIACVLLLPEDIALREGRRIYATIVGAAINHDAGRSHDFLSPSPEAQTELVQQALLDARLTAKDIGYIEAHGTGTPIGDSIELSSLASVFADTEHPVYVGSVKSNIGHTEGCAGLFGVIKAALALWHGVLPRTLHVAQQSAAVAWTETSLELARQTQRWPATVPRRAGVSSFGLTGTNAHCLLEGVEATTDAPPTASGAGPRLLVLSSADEAGLQRLATVYAQEQALAPLGELADALFSERELLRWRLVGMATSAAEAQIEWRKFAAGDGTGRMQARAALSRPRVVFVCPGQGGQWLGMGQRLWQTSHVFRARIEDIDAAMERQFGWRVSAVWDDAQQLARIERVQPTLFAMAVALAAVWEERGVVPEAVIGTSMGEVAAAVLSGSLTLEAGVRVIGYRSQLMARLRGNGAMLSLLGPRAEVEDLLRRWPSLSVAVYNGPAATVVAGATTAIGELKLAAEALGMECRWVQVDVASHSAQVDPILDELEHGLADLARPARSDRDDVSRPGSLVSAPAADAARGPARSDRDDVSRPGSLVSAPAADAARGPARSDRDDVSRPGSLVATARFFSTVESARGVVLDAAYWRKNLRAPVRLVQSVNALLAEGFNIFVELGPHEVLTSAIADCASEAAVDALVVGSMRRDEDADATLAAAALSLIAVGGLQQPAQLRASLPTPWRGKVQHLPARPWRGPELSLHPSSHAPAESASAVQRSRSEPAAASHEEALRDKLKASSLAERKRLIGELCADLVRAVLRWQPARAVPEDRGLRELGLTSMMMVEVRNRLAHALEVSLPATYFFERPTIAKVAADLASTAQSGVISRSLLGDILLECGIVNRAQIAEALAYQGQSQGQRLGDVLLKLGFVTPEQLQRALTAQLQEPIAVVGMALRFPGGVANPEAYWQLLRQGRDAVSEVPASRWRASEAPGVPRWGGFIDGIESFDFDFFGIAAMEAERMDPQQRLLLQVTWHALEHAAIDPATLRDSQTGVFVGVSNYNEYARLKEIGGEAHATAFDGVGDATSIVAGRVSYNYGFRGPAIAVDTACSSSLVALHLAAQSLKNQECSVALAAGVNVILTPHASDAFARAGMLAPNGRCKTFDASADGYVRSEGCAVVVLKTLSEARRCGDRVWAMIDATAVNQDGHSAGMTAPNGAAQEALLRTALTRASLSGAEVSYVEAHGTGTRLGDPIELNALGRVYGEGRAANRPLLVGSVKTNLGHLEAAAGMAGLIKTILALNAGQIPPSLHLRRLNPAVDWTKQRLAVVSEAMAWPAGARRIAGVSSFGFSGTNAHVLLEAPATAPAVSGWAWQRPVHLLMLSGPDQAGLRRVAAAWGQYIAGHPAESLGDIAHTLNCGRGLHKLRLGVVAATRQEALAHLEAVAESDGASVATTAPAARQAVRVYFRSSHSVYPRQGAELYAHSPTYRSAFEGYVEALAGSASASLLGELVGAELVGTPGDLSTRQRLMLSFASSMALYDSLCGWGLVPDEVTGEGIGAIAAALASGAITLDQACTATLALVGGDHVSASLAAPLGAPRTRSQPTRVAAATLAELVSLARQDEQRESPPGVPDSTLVMAGSPTGVALLSSGDEWRALCRGLGWLVERNMLDSLREFDAGYGHALVSGPTYPFAVKQAWYRGERAEPAARAQKTGLLLGVERARAAPAEGRVFECEVDVHWPDWLAHHRVLGQVVMPAAGWAEMMLEAGRVANGLVPLALTELVIERPLRIDAVGGVRLQTVLHDDGRVVVHARDGVDEGGAWLAHARGRVQRVDTARASTLADNTRGETHPLTAVYDGFAERGLQYGDRFRLIESAQEAGGATLYRLRPEEDVEAFVLSPMALDAALQGALLAFDLAIDERALWLPIGADRIEVRGGDAAFARVSVDGATSPNASVRRADAELYDEDRRLVASIVGATFRRTSAEAMTRTSERDGEVTRWLYELAWQEDPLSVANEAQRGARWAVVGAADQPVAEIVAALRALDLVAEAKEAAVALREASGGERSYVWLVPRADAVGGGSGGERTKARLEETLRPLLELSQQIGSGSGQARLVVVTEGAQPILGDVRRPWHASAWGFVRVLASEQPQLTPRLIDCDNLAETTAALAAEVANGAGEDEVGLYGGRRYVARLGRYRAKRLVLPASESFALAVSKRGRLDALRLVPKTLPHTLAAREVEVCVDAAGLNFRDVLNAMGLYPGDAGDLGGDFAGRVTRVGAGVTSLAAGDRVFGFGTGALARYVVVDERLVCRTPTRIAEDDAATLVSPFLTAIDGLVQRAELGRGQRVLIHSAAGGVGLAALQVARRLGAVVFATASKSKHAYLRTLGVAHLYDSRSDGFFEQVLADTGNEGVDVVLNALTGDKLRKSLALVRPGGTFIEIGKTELLSAAEVGAQAARGVRYERVAIDERATSDPNWFVDAFAALAAGLADGLYAPLPREDYDIEAAPDAFRRMARGLHVGKVVLHLARRASTWVAPIGACLVSGGFGAIGSSVGEWLAQHGAQEIILLGRSAPGARALAAIERMRALGAAVVVERGDVTDEGALSLLVERARARRGKIALVMHAAGVLRDAVIAQQDWPAFERVLWPKVVGAELLRALAPEAVVFESFSSIAALIGNGGQSNYAAANAYLDALAFAAERMQSIQWWAWANEGMAAASNQAGRAFERPLAVGEGLNALEAALLGGGATATVVPISWAGLLAKRPTLARAGKYRSLVAERLVGNEQPATWLAALVQLPEGARPAAIAARVRGEVTNVLGKQLEIADDRPLIDLGVDSLSAIELRNRLSTLFAQSLPASFVFDYPTVQALTRQLLARGGLVSAPAAPSARTQAISASGVAVVGLSCRFPAGGNDERSFWQLLAEGRDGISEVPKERWDVDAYYDPRRERPGKMATRWGGFLHDVDVPTFDAEFFGITPKEAQTMDPQQRLLLECVWEALENSGYPPTRLAGSRTGTFIGLSTSDYAQLLTKLGTDAIDPYRGTGTLASVAAGRISYVFGFQGPAMTIDTACSSSLYALHHATNALRAGECDLAVVGAVNLMLAPDLTIYFSRGGFMAADGRCKTFDASADGYVRGEGCGVLILKRQADAERDGDRVRAIVRGTAVNQDGRSGGLTVPNGPAQEAVIRDALARAGVRPSDVDYVEAHGTGTQLGDPIEANALANVYAEGRAQNQPLLVGSVKTNIGHLEAAAGMASLIKVILAMEHAEIPAQLHLRTPNRKISWAEVPLSVVTRPVMWATHGGKKRLAGISGFAFQGSNAHVIIEEGPERAHPAITAPAPAGEALLLSAKSEDALRAQAGKYARFLADTSDTLHDIARTAAHHREHFAWRLGLVARGNTEAADKLERFFRAGNTRGIWVAQAKQGMAPAASAAQTPDQLCAEWVNGAEPVLQLSALAANAHVDLPYYPFQRRRFWFESHAETPSNPRSVLGERTELASDSDQLIHTVAVRAGEWSEHRVGGQEIWPAAAHLWRALRAGAEMYGNEKVRLQEVDITRAVPLGGGDVRLQQIISRASGRFVVYTQKEHDAWTQCASGQLSVVDVAPPASSWRPVSERTNVDQAYAELDALGITYTGVFRSLCAIYSSGKQVWAELDVDAMSGASSEQRAIALLDGCLQALSLLLGRQHLYLPIAVGELTSFASPLSSSGKVRCWLDGEAAEIARGGFELHDSGGNLALVARGVVLKRTSIAAVTAQAERSRVEQWVYQLDWREQARSAARADPRATWTVLYVGTEQRASAELLVTALRASTAGATATEIGAFGDGSGTAGIVCLLGRHTQVDAAVLRETLEPLLALVRRLRGPRLVLVTEGAQATSDEDTVVRPWHAAGWGMLRALAHERPELEARLIDVWGYEAAAPAIASELAAMPGEEEVCLRSDGRRYVSRLHRASVGLEPPEQAPNWRLTVSQRGTLEHLRPEATDRAQDLGEHQVELAVEQVGLNFRDVLNVLGEYPGDPGPPGSDCAGRVVRTGAQVTRVKVGDAVYGFAGGCIGRYAQTDERLLSTLPATVSSAQAVTQLSTLMTADYGLLERGRLARNERVLIHAAAGGVGLAAIQIAQRAGAEIYATASASKHAHLRGLGVTHIYDSRSAAFYDQILRDTGGQGVDVVLNALTGEKRTRSVQLLRPAGRFIEIGKAELLSADAFAALCPHGTYHQIALDDLMHGDRAWFAGAFERLERGWQEGYFQPLPVTRFGVRQAREAFRYLAQGKNIGKVVIDLTGGGIERSGSYVISGGLGALGLTVGEWLADKGAKEIVLFGRRAPGADSAPRLARMRAAGASVVVEQGDVVSGADVARICVGARSRQGKIAGIVHAAGVLHDAMLPGQSWTSYAEVLGPKVLGAYNLIGQTDLETVFVHFSSIAAVLGNAGQTGYAAANAVLDALALQQARSGRRHLSIDWGPWAGAGMAAERLATRGSESLLGLHALGNDEGLRILASLLDERRVQTVVLGADIATLVRHYEGARLQLPRKLRDLASDHGLSNVEPHALAADSALATELLSLPIEARSPRLQQRIRAEVQQVMGGAQSEIAADKPLMELGVDSLMAVELRNRLSGLMARTLPVSFVFDYPTVEALSRQLLERAGLLEAAATRSTRIKSAADNAAVAVVGLACRLPGGSNDEESYWQMLLRGRSGVVEVPRDRWDIDAYYDPDPEAPAKMTTRWGGFLDGVDIGAFDSGFFGIMPKEARTLDPQQRLLLETAWQALENAGLVPGMLAGSPTGVFLGISSYDYALMLSRLGDAKIDRFRGTGTLFSAAAGRLSYFFGFQGPAMAIDTACSSSLYALHHAVASLRSGECDIALVGAVNLLLAPDLSIYFSRAGFMAPDGRCKAFDATANGYVRGEGCGVLVLKRQDDAERDGDRIRALVRGTAVNQDGRSGGLTVPNGPAQEAVIRQALASAAVAPGEIDYVETHGTGTPLGDPIEVQALANVYAAARRPEHPLLIGSVKTNIGHLEAAAGMASLIKVILSMERGTLPGQLHFHSPSAKIAWSEMALSVVTAPTAWPRRAGHSRLAGVSGFAFQGSNAHAIIEEPPISPATSGIVATPSPTPTLLVLSAKSEEALREQIADYASLLAETHETLADIAHTALYHRAWFDWRFALIARTAREAGEQLRKHALGEEVSHLWRGKALAGAAERVLPTDVTTSIETLAASWVEGTLDLRKIPGFLPGKRVDLPFYPFQRKRYWF